MIMGGLGSFCNRNFQTLLFENWREDQTQPLLQLVTMATDGHREAAAVALLREFVCDTTTDDSTLRYVLLRAGMDVSVAANM